MARLRHRDHDADDDLHPKQTLATRRFFHSIPGNLKASPHFTLLSSTTFNPKYPYNKHARDGVLFCLYESSFKSITLKLIHCERSTQNLYRAICDRGIPLFSGWRKASVFNDPKVETPFFSPACDCRKAFPGAFLQERSSVSCSRPI